MTTTKTQCNEQANLRAYIRQHGVSSLSMASVLTLQPCARHHVNLAMVAALLANVQPVDAPSLVLLTKARQLLGHVHDATQRAARNHTAANVRALKRKKAGA